MKSVVKWFIVVVLFFSAIVQGKDNQEFRAVWVVTWDHISSGLSASQNKANVRKILDNMKAAHMNAVLWHARQSGTAYYNSSYEPWGYYAGYSYPGYDPLAYAIEEAHKRGIEVHAWFNVFHVASTHAGTVADKHPEWICTNEDGQFMTAHRCASPGLEAVRDYTIKVAMEIVRNYDVDGLHLDFVRWNEYTEDDMQNPPSPLQQVSELDGVIPPERLEKLSKAAGSKRYIYDVEHPASGGVPAGFGSWDEWRRWSVTEFVRQLHDSIQAVKPWVRLSPAALGKYKAGGTSGWNGYYIVWQDAALWFNEGYVDQLTPMHYHWLTGEDLKAAIESDWYPNIQEGLQAGRLYSVGPGSYRMVPPYDPGNGTYDCWDNHPGIVEAMRTLNWVDGFQFFSYSSWASQNYWHEAGSTFFDRINKIRAAKYLLNETPPSPTLNLTKIDSMNYEIAVVPPDTVHENQWFALYRSLDNTLNVKNDRILTVRFGKTPFTYLDSYWGQKPVHGRYTYYATMLDRYWNESQISNAAGADSVPDYVNPPAVPQDIRVLYKNASSLIVECDPMSDAEKYTVYISGDGVTFSDTVVSSSNRVVVSGLQQDKVYYFKMSAGNRGGNSDTEGHWYAGVPTVQKHKVLVINGFDRNTNTRFDYITKYADAIRERGYGFSNALNDAVINGKIKITDYKGLIWFLGDESVADESFSQVEQDSIKRFLDRGGFLLVSGAEIGYDLDHKGSESDRSFYHNYLKTEYAADAPDGKQSEFYSCTPVPGQIMDIIPDFHFDDGTHGTFDVDWPDALRPIGGAKAIMYYKNAVNTNIAGLVYEGAFPGGSKEGKLVYFGFPVETVYPDDVRAQIVSRVFDLWEGKISDITVNDIQPQRFTLEQNYPNPFNPMTTIRYQIAKESTASLTIYTILGRKVRTLVQGNQPAGRYQVIWDGRNDAGRQVSSGMYVYTLRAGSFIQTRKMMLMR